MDARANKPSRLRRYAKRGAIALGGLLGLVVLLLVGALFSLRFAAVRSFVVAQVNGALDGTFKGRLVLHGVGNLGLSGISGADAEVFDPAGRRVLDVHGLSAQLSVPTIVWAALTEKSKPLTIRITGAALRHIEAVLIDNGSGVPTLADTFLPKTPSAPSSGPGTVVIIDRMVIDHVWAHGSLAGTPPLDVELKNAQAKLRTDDVATAIAFEKVSLIARGLPQGVDPVGDLKASLDIPAAADKPLGARAHYQGSAAQVPVVLDASYLDSKLTATLEARDIAPAAVQKQIPALELRSPAALSASAEGKLPKLHGAFSLALGSGKVLGDFDLNLEDDLTAKTNVRTVDLDLAELTPSAPASNLDLTLHAALLAPKVGPITGNFELASEASLIAAQALPGILLNGSFSSDAPTQRNRIEAHAEVAEPGAQTSIDATVTQSQRTNVEFRSKTVLNDAPRLNRLASLSRGKGQIDTQGSYLVEAQSLNAKIHAELRELKQAENQIARAELRATVSGALPQPDADVYLTLNDARLAGQRVSSAKIAARGSLARLALTATVDTTAPERQVHVATTLSNSRGLLVDHPSINLHQGDTNLTIAAQSVHILAGRTHVTGMHLEGAGKADVSLVYGATLESLHAQTYDLDLARLWRLVDPHAVLKAGTATLSASYQRRGQDVRAQLAARSDNLSFDRIAGGSFNANFELERDRLSGTAQADLKQLGRLDFNFPDLRGIDLENPDPARVTGKVAINGQVRLKDLTQLVPTSVDLPFERALGVVKYDLSIERKRMSPGLPTFHVHVATNKLQLAGKRTTTTTITTKEEARDTAPLAIKGIDIDLDVSHEESGETELAANIRDAQGTLVALSIEGKATPRLATVITELSNQWREIPLRARLSLPARDLQKLPPEVRPAALKGVASVDLSYEGTFSAPRLEIAGKLSQFQQTNDKGAKLDVELQGGYKGTRGTLSAKARSAGRDVAQADIDFQTAVREWLDRTSEQTPALDANAHLTFDGFPIGLVPAARTSQVEGALSGKVALEHFGKDATVDLALDVQSLKLANSELGRIRAEAAVRDGKADAKLSVEGKGGTTTAEGHSGLDWGARLVPAVRMPAHAQLRARELRLAAFAPLLTSVLGDLDGRLNGDLNAHFRGGAPELNGHVDLSDGVAQLAALGQRFDQIKARLSLEPGKAKLEEMSARATAGRLRVTGEARFDGLDLTGADARVSMSEDEKVTLSLAGTELGETYGAIEIKLRPGQTKGSQALSVNVPELHVRMPDAGSQDLQDLAPAKGVRVGTRQRDGGFVTLPLQPLQEGDPSKNDNPMVVDLDLGDQIWIQQGDTTKIQLGGRLQLVLGDPLTIEGIIRVKSGKLDVSGKQFEVESGVVTFSGEPDNPTIVATARWDAPDADRHRVYADASGTAAKLKVSLRAEPTLTRDQILSLLLTGSADGTLGGGGGNNAATAVGAVGGVATQGLNKALSNIADLDVSTRIDTSTGSARPELVIQLSAKVSASITRALGHTPGQPPDMTFLNMDFLIKRNWSLSTLTGDRGASGVDLVWRKRY
ncbi:MAG TPA: translocation/assembly module TamB domain-containing protein [Polyangiaceae bacterium]|nr:translocation/assembly module TamB domain-containing protein [Polyangiaceae bacterium]